MEMAMEFGLGILVVFALWTWIGKGCITERMNNMIKMKIMMMMIM